MLTSDMWNEEKNEKDKIKEKDVKRKRRKIPEEDESKAVENSR